MDRMKQIIQENKKFSVLVLIAFLGYSINYAFNIILSHAVSGGLYGDFTIGIRTLSIASFVILLGTASSAKRFLSEYLTEHDHASSADYIHWNLKFISRSSIFFLSGLVALILIMIALHIFEVKNITNYHLAIYLLFITPLTAFSVLIASYLECNNNIILYNIINYGKYFLFIILILGTVHFFHPVFNNMLLWIITLSVYGILSCIECILAVIYLPNDIIKIILNFSKNLTRSSSLAWEKTSLKLVFSQLIYLVVSILDLYAVKIFTDKASVNQYSALLNINMITLLVAGSIFSTMVSSISFYLKNKQLDRLQEELDRSNLDNFVVLTIITLCLIGFGHHILNFFGPGYATYTSYIALVIMAMGYYFSTLAFGAIQLLSYSENANWLIYISSAEIVLITVLATALTKYFGIIGAATASNLTLLFSTVAYIFVARVKTGVKSCIFI